MSSAISGKIPDSLLKEIDTWKLWAEKPKIEFEDPTARERIKKFDKELQISTVLLLELNKIKEVYDRHVLVQHPDAITTGNHVAIKTDNHAFDVYLRCLNKVEPVKKELEERIGRLKKENKSSYKLLNWIKEKNENIKDLLENIPEFYHILHKHNMHIDCSR